MFAPAKGLERGRDGKVVVDKEKVQEKVDVEFQGKKGSLVEEEFKN